MLESIELYNFKSARELKVRLAALTVLTGLNGSGKSTVLQVLALLKQSLHTDARPQNLVLRGQLIQLGRSEDVLSENAGDDDIRFIIQTPKGRTSLSALAEPDSDTLKLSCDGSVKDVVNALDKGFQFIQADRITPAIQYQQASTPDRAAGWLGCGGEYTVDFLLQNETKKISHKRFAPPSPALSDDLLKQVAPTGSLLDQTSGWLQHLSPGVQPRATAVKLSDSVSLKFSYIGIGSNRHERRPSNVGFGLTYCLPIIVACLAAPKGALLLLENPEAHLHPRGQFALGLLLARCAADGVQIIIETHSDHVLNGVRIAAKRADISSDDVAVHFFSRNIASGETSLISPILHANGRFSEWPDGFFDEWSNALDELLED
ncbi:hypothetical protein AGMMS49543_15880 [Betaproteobacteria bacterium]|nr:hypothetical protein AGMMS49543_15880 [Betaproteobacteria bacterium]GHU19312.1 hypothetical protein AGMMS50243_11030 [Betaproteobacteria bacterium]